MRKLKIRNQEVLPAMGVLTTVEGLSLYDMIYVYHLLHDGTSLLLSRDFSHPFDRTAVAVSFRGFKLGYLSPKTSPMVFKHLDNRLPVSAYIKQMSRKKYLPIESLEIEIRIF